MLVVIDRINVTSSNGKPIRGVEIRSGLGRVPMVLLHDGYLEVHDDDLSASNRPCFTYLTVDTGGGPCTNMLYLQNVKTSPFFTNGLSIDGSANGSNQVVILDEASCFDVTGRGLCWTNTGAVNAGCPIVLGFQGKVTVIPTGDGRWYLTNNMIPVIQSSLNISGLTNLSYLPTLLTNGLTTGNAAWLTNANSRSWTLFYSNGVSTFSGTALVTNTFATPYSDLPHVSFTLNSWTGTAPVAAARLFVSVTTSNFVVWSGATATTANQVSSYSVTVEP